MNFRKLSLKVLKIFLYLLTLIVLLVIIIPQYKAEKYLEIVNRDSVFNNVKRLRYIPFTIFYVKHKFIEKDYYELSQYARIPYEIKGVHDRYFFGHLYGTYFAHCYYDLDTLKKYKSLSSLIKQYNYHFHSSLIVDDTLKLISNSNYFYECFGKFRNPKNLITSFNRKKFKVNKEPGDDIYRIKSDESFLKYIFIDEDKKMDLVSGMIKSQKIVMTNGLRVGLTKKEVENILFHEKRYSLEKVNNVQITTALLGLWINLKFVGENLNEIKIDTDYQVNKE